MRKIVSFPTVLKLQLKDIAIKRGHNAASEILDRGEPEELLLDSQTEAQMLINLARMEMTDTSLKYPFWNEDLPNYNTSHEDAFQDIQMGIFEKTIMYLDQVFELSPST